MLSTAIKIRNETDIDTNGNSTTEIDSGLETPFTAVFFYIFLLLAIPSDLCSLSLFYYFLRLPEIRRGNYSHHMVIYVLATAFLMNMIDIPFILVYLHDNYYFAARNYTHSFCIFWIIYDYTMWSLTLWTMALFSLERYLSIFFQQLLTKTAKRRIFMYYFSVPSAAAFVFAWYIYLVVFYPCAEPHFDLTQILCGHACFSNEASEILLNLDWIITGLLPMFLTIFFTLVLILHVLYQAHKISRHLIQRDTWKRTRKMFLQLLPITSTFFLFTMPLIIIGLHEISDPSFSATPYFYANLLSYGFPLTFSFVILFKERIIQRRFLRLVRPIQLHGTVPVAITIPAVINQYVHELPMQTISRKISRV